jgi:Iap family predicted aminopeptidase
MQQMYENVDEKQKTQRVLHDLRQIKSTTNYASKFQLYIARIDYDEKTFMTCYRQELKNRVKNMMMLTKRFKNLYALINKSIKIDNTQYERELEKKDDKQIFLEQRKKKSEYYSIEMKLDAIIKTQDHSKK